MTKIDGGLRALFRQHIPQFDWQAIETAVTGGGVPDSNYCREGTEGWIEFKKTPGWTVPLAPAQVGWIMRRVRAGGRVWIGVRQGGLGRDTLWLIPGLWAVSAKAGGLRGGWVVEASRAGQGVQCWPGGPAKWDWEAVAKALVTRVDNWRAIASVLGARVDGP